MNPKVKMIDRLIRDQAKLFPDFPENDDGLREVIDQIVTGKPGRKVAKLYQCLVESFIMVGGSDQSNQGYYDRQKVKPSYHRIKKAVQQAACSKLASFETYHDCGYRKGNWGTGSKGSSLKSVVFTMSGRSWLIRFFLIFS